MAEFAINIVYFKSQMSNNYKSTNLSNVKVKVGWIDGSGAAARAYENLQIRKSNTGIRTPALREPATQALIARTLNYGREAGVTLEGRRYPPIPARPFMEEAKRIFEGKWPKIVKQCVRELTQGSMTKEAAAKRIAVRVQDAIVEAIRTGEYRELSKATVAARERRFKGKGATAVPLIDTGAMVNSITAEARFGR